MRVISSVSYKDYLRVGEAAKFLGICMQTLRNWEKKGKFKTYRHPISSYRLYKREELESILVKGK